MSAPVPAPRTAQAFSDEQRERLLRAKARRRQLRVIHLSQQLVSAPAPARD